MRYEFRFTSLIAPNSKSPGLFTGQYKPSSSREKRVLFKKSFLIASWFYYLSRREIYDSISLETSKSLKLAILPAKQQIYTLTKAPMAHKTNSKEQFLFRYYNFKFSASLNIDYDFVPSSVLQGAFTLNKFLSSFPTFETNVLFLKYARVKYPLYDLHFFRYLTLT